MSVFSDSDSDEIIYDKNEYLSEENNLLNIINCLSNDMNITEITGAFNILIHINEYLYNIFFNKKDTYKGTNLLKIIEHSIDILDQKLKYNNLNKLGFVKSKLRRNSI